MAYHYPIWKDESMRTIERTEQWAPEGILSGRPGIIMDLLSEDGKTFGYGPGPGWSFMFGTKSEKWIAVEPGQWVTRYSDGTVTVTDDKPSW